MIQCFVKKNLTFSYSGSLLPKLLYVCKVDEEDSVHPRVMHSHDDLVEVILICTGKGEYHIGGKMCNVKEGDLLIFNSGTIHDEISNPNPEISSYCCAISDIKLDGLRKNALIADDENSIIPCGRYFSTLQDIFKLMFSTLSKGYPGAEETCHYLMMALLVQIKNLLNKVEDSQDLLYEEPNVLGERIKEYIDEHYREDISLQTLSNDLNISMYYLSHIFKETIGYSPFQYILRRRIGEAQTLLITTNYPITQISSMVGYDNLSNFSLIFKKYVGMSPSKYRKSYVVNSNS